MVFRAWRSFWGSTWKSAAEDGQSAPSHAQHMSTLLRRPRENKVASDCIFIQNFHKACCVFWTSFSRHSVTPQLFHIITAHQLFPCTCCDVYNSCLSIAFTYQCSTLERKHMQNTKNSRKKELLFGEGNNQHLALNFGPWLLTSEPGEICTVSKGCTTELLHSSHLVNTKFTKVDTAQRPVHFHPGEPEAVDCLRSFRQLLISLKDQKSLCSLNSYWFIIHHFIFDLRPLCAVQADLTGDCTLNTSVYVMLHARIHTPCFDFRLIMERYSRSKTSNILACR